ncbi:hypothetical protein A3A03_02235 [Candidatus Nomurabacteria bacterium RIFCSPLOWO2_01_FULL_40_18]|uniref:Response regulatory domain-containing protein n=1 Tax=Candidatus Nomurabacteria bacterium RIFCSPLOWO2_01_FULL_40_18 TaxID=1801773 RepID=A0A1F6XLC3_9BACT|nr:MAG: hypothetical protein A3A03_02235 [Candidatus Nomurabacteria bacterium RIFCSPLOWO2_01_FULL_40_18]
MIEQNKTSILVVEDEVLISTALTDELKDTGFKVLTAENGEQGLKIALNDKPHLILLDILMPVMNGITMMEKLRESGEWGKKVPIILLTNLSPNEDKIITAISKDAPVYYFIKSDWKLSDIAEKIKEVLAHK